MRRHAGFIGLPMPYLILSIIALVAGVYLVGRHNGAAAKVQQQRAELLEHTQRAIEQANELAEQDAQVFAATAVERERVRTVFQTIDREVIRYAQDHASDTGECLDADGLRLWHAANAGSAEAFAPAGKLDYTLSGRAAAAGLGQGDGPAGQPRRGGEAVPRLQAPAPRLGWVGEERGGR